MLEILLAVKNNNFTKIPNYDPSHFEHLKKILKTFIREGCLVYEMKIGLKVGNFIAWNIGLWARVTSYLEFLVIGSGAALGQPGD